MDFNRLLATIWFYLYPTLLVVTMGLCIVGILRRREKAKAIYIFSYIFFGGVFLGYMYYLINLYSNTSKSISLLSATESFYYWFYYLAIWLFLTDVFLTLLFVIVQKYNLVRRVN
jgi:hypothetical protein